MTETIKYSKIGLEDLRRGEGTFEVTLADGRVVTMSEISPFNLGDGLGADTTNTWLGRTALDSKTSGTNNVAVGLNALTALTTGSGNVAGGRHAGLALTTGGSNVALGNTALAAMTTGNNNIAIGEEAMTAYNNGTGTPNVAIGYWAIHASTGAPNGDACVAVGDHALSDMTSGYSNAAFGDSALEKLTTGFKNVAIGSRCMAVGVVTGDNNVGVGRVALHGLTGGANNVGVGANVLYQLNSGSGNTAVGVDAGGGSSGNGVTTGTNNTFVGYGAKQAGGAQLTNATAIGYNATVNGDNQMVFGNASVTGYGFGTSNPGSALVQIEFATTNGVMIRNTATSGVAGIFLKNPSRQWDLYVRGDSAGAFYDEFRIDDATATTSPFRIQAAGVNNALVLATGGVAKIAGTALRATTEGTNHLDIFDGTAPVGTLANGCSLYSTAGELRVMDAAGNATLLSPHDHDGYWIYHSKDTTTGKVLKIDMERMLKKLNHHFGWDFIQEFLEA